MAAQAGSRDSFGDQQLATTDEQCQCIGCTLIGCGWFCCGILPCCCWPEAIWTVRDYQRAIIFRLGKMIGEGGPGLFVVNPFTDSVVIIDLRIQTIDMRVQEVITKDSVTAKIDAIVLIQVVSPKRAVMEVTDYYRATSMLAATTLQMVIGSTTLNELLTQRGACSEKIKASLDVPTDKWGVKVTHVEIKDVSLPTNMQRAMAAAAEAEREAHAKEIAAGGEFRAAAQLKAAADIIAEQPASLQLRYLQTLGMISAEQNSTIIFPVPLSIMEGFCQLTRPQRRPSEEDRMEVAPNAQAE